MVVLLLMHLELVTFRQNQMHKIVIVGGGAGGLELATRLGKSYRRDKDVSVTLVDTNRTHM